MKRKSGQVRVNLTFSLTLLAWFSSIFYAVYVTLLRTERKESDAYFYKKGSLTPARFSLAKYRGYLNSRACLSVYLCIFLAALSSSRSDVVTLSVRLSETLLFFSPKRSYGAFKPPTTLGMYLSIAAS